MERELLHPVDATPDAEDYTEFTLDKNLNANLLISIIQT